MNVQSSLEKNRQTYVVRFARESTTTPWRIVVQATGSSESHYFADLPALHRFFTERTHVKKRANDNKPP